MITAINSEVDYTAALAEIEQLIDHNVRAGTRVRVMDPLD
jgi:antitoxin component HigA of HigAB toxin-antitoxin module